MRKIGLVIKHEIVSTIGKPSFWLTTLILPLLIMLLSGGAQLMGVKLFKEEEPFAEEAVAIGYVDQAGIIATLPPGLPTDLIRAYDDESEARAALMRGEIRQYYLIAPDYLTGGQLTVVERDFSPLGDVGMVELFDRILTYNLVEGDALLTARLAEPIAEQQERALGIATATAEQPITGYVVGYGLLFIFFFIFSMSSSYMLRSVSQEKENRTMEVLLVSLRPRELMWGKVIGLGSVALLQLGLWLGGGLFGLRRASTVLEMFGVTLSALELPPGFVFWAVAYFLLGYILYASILGAIGALAPNARETGAFTFIALLPLMVPLWVSDAFFQSPHGLLATALSLFPLTAPTSMLPRWVMGGVPTWQLALSLGGLALTTYAIVLLSARFFRADTLLSTRSLKPAHFWQVLKAGRGT